jgi:hypothetical protein
MWTAIIIGASILGFVVLMTLIVLIGKVVLHSIKGPLESRIAEHYGPEDVVLKDLGANCFGLESKGVMQWRGNGALILTEKTLHFFMFLPKWDLPIPLADITEMTFTKKHLGKATIYDLLKVRFQKDGQSDSIAWYLADPRAWRERIEELRTGRPIADHS